MAENKEEFRYFQNFSARATSDPRRARRCARGRRVTGCATTDRPRRHTGAPPMADITEYETQQLDRANATGKTPVVFIHGLWLLPSSWDRWRTAFEAAGYATLSPGWPDDPNTVDEANRHPEVFAHQT